MNFKYILLVLMLMFSSFLYSQSILISGIVVDEGGNPLPGVTVLIEGTNKGTSTTFEGTYAIKADNENQKIQFSYISFETQSILIGNQTKIDVIMVESLESLEEVQVVAFQKQKKNSVIGSINTINPSELKIPTSNITNAMAGKLAGMISYQRSGEPGADNAEFFIRGVTSFGYANNPLILIDGLEVTTNDLARIEPDNIASFSIMKDATATSLYGARGANGVILITSKDLLHKNMKKFRKLKNGESAEELESSINLIIKTKCPTKWIIEDLETGQRYRANGNEEIGKMFTLIESSNAE